MIQLDDVFETLAGVRLDTVQPEDEAEVRAAADDAETWRWFTFRADGAYFATQFWPNFLVHHRSAEEYHFIVRHRGKVVGATCFLAVSDRHKRLEIGGTWYTSAARGSVVNPVCKFLLLQRAFDWGARRVEIKTDSQNARSRAAIEKLGGVFEGTLRNHMILHDGSQRHTVYYSIIPEEWPVISAKLQKRIENTP
jgi:RimJ/RimL family protein N-acetyltransferase